MAKDLKEELKDVMAKRKVKVPKLSIALDIPKDRIYAWYRDNTNPKGDDREKIKKWINEENYNVGTDNSDSDPLHKSQTEHKKGNDLDKFLVIAKTLSESVNDLTIVAKKQIEIIDRLTNNTTSSGNGSAPTASM
jgi:hypothetical protein